MSKQNKSFLYYLKFFLITLFSSIYLIILWFYIYVSYTKQWEELSCMLVYVANNFQWCTYQIWNSYHIDECWLDEKLPIQKLSISNKENSCIFSPFKKDLSWYFDSMLSSTQCILFKTFYNILPQSSEWRTIHKSLL